MIWDTIRLNRKIKPAASEANIFFPYRGTKLGDDCFERGLVDEKLYFNFSNERRDTVLKYSKEFRCKLLHYRDQWDELIYPFDMKRRAKKWLKKLLFR